MASGGSMVGADAATCAYLRRFASVADLNAIYKQAWEAHQARQLEVTITNVNLDSEGGSGEIAGDPAVLMAACEVVLQEKDGQRGPSAASLISFRRRRVET